MHPGQPPARYLFSERAKTGTRTLEPLAISKSGYEKRSRIFEAAIS